MENVDILGPPTFEKSGVVKPRSQAVADGDWIGTFNLWILHDKPTPSIVYQQRSSHSTWAPSKLDVTAGGHYMAGETIYDGLREVDEELGKKYKKENLVYLGRKLHVGPDVHGLTHHNVVDIFFVTDNSALETYQLEKNEVSAIVSCPVDDLIKFHLDKKEFLAHGLNNEGEKFKVKVTNDSFPYNWDNYHFKISMLAKRFLNGEKDLYY